jgi:hypothetical protein
LHSIVTRERRIFDNRRHRLRLQQRSVGIGLAAHAVDRDAQAPRFLKVVADPADAAPRHSKSFGQPSLRAITVAHFRVQDVHEERRQRLRQRRQRGVRQDLELPGELLGDEILRVQKPAHAAAPLPGDGRVAGTVAGL